jgi:hypothetical protein
MKYILNIIGLAFAIFVIIGFYTMNQNSFLLKYTPSANPTEGNTLATGANKYLLLFLFLFPMIFIVLLCIEVKDEIKEQYQKNLNIVYNPCIVSHLTTNKDGGGVE